MIQVVFQETQRFRQIWIWVLILGITGIAIGSLFLLEGEDPLTYRDLAFPIGMLLLLNILFLSFTLSTRIEVDCLSFRFFPFTRWRNYHFEDVEAMELVEYNGFWDYGGWGIKWNGDSWSYTTGGKWGILVQTSKKKFLLGTQKPEEAKQAVAQFLAFKSASPES
ncbi:MAG: hypothetical protein O2829_09670 [Bacteroidetes bacterium]|nr:hypothetical protein [Bacteroidota bacterium]